ncbi:MAG: type I 3-dehydroquinate dehydratase [Breznakia sp.]
MKIKNIEIGMGMPKICVSIVGKTIAEIKQQVMQIQGLPFDMVEWRMDYVECLLDEAFIHEVVAYFAESLIQYPILATFRTQAEGGKKRLSYHEYTLLYETIIRANQGVLDLIDIEYQFGKKLLPKFLKLAHQHHMFVVLSLHDFVGTPALETVVEQLVEMQDTQADIVKVAYMALSEKDVKWLQEAMQMIQKKVAFVAISMGAFGQKSRTQGELYGNAMTFASIQKNGAEGQLNVQNVYDMQQIVHRQKAK